MADSSTPKKKKDLPVSKPTGHNTAERMTTLTAKTWPAWPELADTNTSAPAPCELPVSDDLQLAQLAASGDRPAQEAVAKRVLPVVRRITRALANCVSDADDASQIALIEILRSTSTYKATAKLEAWAKRITVRSTLRHLKRETRQRHDDIDDVALEDTTTQTPGTRIQDALPRELRDYLAIVSESQRTAIVLHHGLGYSLTEVAEMTDVSSNTVKGRMRLGLAILRKQLRRDAAVDSVVEGKSNAGGE